MVGGGAGSIPSSDRKTIELIREITRKQHSDDEIYAVLKECSMDPNETAQKLMFLDTFHEVKRKREKRKESVQNRSQDSGPAASAQRRGTRSGRGNYSSFHVPAGRRDVAGRRNVNGQRENGISESTERGSVPSLPRHSEGAAKVSTVLPGGHGSLPNGNSSQSHVSVNLSEKVAVEPPSSSAPKSTFSSLIEMEPGKSASQSDYSQAPASPASASGLNAASDPVLVPSLKPLQPGAVGTIKREVGTQDVPGEGNSELMSVLVGSVCENFVHDKTPQKIEAVELNHTSKESESMDSLIIAMDATNIDDSHSSQELSVPSKVMTADANSHASPETNVSNGHLVTFPNNFQVPEAIRNALTFGSIEVSFGAGVMHVNDSLCGDSNSADPKSPQESKETPEGISSRPSTSSDDLVDEDPDQSLSPQQGPEEVPPSEENIPSGIIQETDKPKQDDLIPSEGPQGLQHSALHGIPNDTHGFVHSMIGNQIVQLDNTKNQPQDVSAILNYMGGNPFFQATSTPPLTQQGVMQSSVPMSPQPLLPLFRQPYPPNYFPYGHYIPMIMPHMQQFLSPNGIPQQASTGSIYIPSQSPAAGIKYPVPQFKPGANVANPTPFGIPSAYGSYSPSPMGYNLGPTMTSGSSAGNGDLAAPQLKENHVYTTAQLQNDGSAAWIPRAGQDMTGLAVNSSYSMLPQSQHVTYPHPQAVHGPYAGILQPAQSITAPSVHTLLQQSQAMAGGIESARPQSGIYQHAQHAQMWN